MENRQELWDKYTGSKPNYIAHAWLHYDRYHEAQNIINTIKKRKEQIGLLTVLDYGCGVGDYGMAFGREGASVTFFDLKEEIDFVKYRKANEEKPFSFQFLEVGTVNPILSGNDVVIFGEVLEHLDDPFKTLEDAVYSNTKYIFTSSYPFRSDDPNDPYWHHRGHKDHGNICALQKPCRELLSSKYVSVKFDGQARLWIRK